ncbi:MAG: DNA replication protein [Micavibrio sp.]|nr:DNA replication protein [Micavibrio sp.]
MRAEQIPLDFAGRSALGREDFLIGPSNADAVAWIDRWPDWPAPLLIINGPVASGKSHLAAVWSEQADAVNVPAAALHEISAEQTASMGDRVVIDGIDLAIGWREAETTLFHLYNIFKEEQRSFLVTTRLNVSVADFAIADLASRMRAAPNATIRAPDDILLGSVLIKLFSDRQLSVGNDVIKYILPRMERSFAAARALVERMDKIALSRKKGVSIALAREALEAIT